MDARWDFLVFGWDGFGLNYLIRRISLKMK